MNNYTVDDIATEAYLFLYPLVIMDVTRRQIMSRSPIDAAEPGANLFLHNRDTATDRWRSVARPNFDTLFSSAWIDLSNGPVTLTIPASGERYHMFQALDMWTDTYAVIGTRTVGNGGCRVMIVSPQWRDAPLGDADHRIVCPTTTTWIIGRTYASLGADTVHARTFLDGVTAVSSVGGALPDSDNDEPEVSPSVAPVKQVDGLSAEQFFRYASRLVQREGIHFSDGSMSLRLSHVGFNPGVEFDFVAQTEQVKQAIIEAPRRALARLRHSSNVAGIDFLCWTTSAGNIGYYGNNYMRRATIARFGLAANPPEDAVYISSTVDTNGETLSGARTYRMHFEKGQLPPADAFWSVTAYGQQGFLIPNELNRFGIRSKDPIEFNDDGSLDITIGPQCPAGFASSNWIPSVDGPIDFSIRLYSPGARYVEGEWVPPLIEHISG